MTCTGVWGDGNKPLVELCLRSLASAGRPALLARMRHASARPPMRKVLRVSVFCVKCSRHLRKHLTPSAHVICIKCFAFPETRDVAGAVVTASTAHAVRSACNPADRGRRDGGWGEHGGCRACMSAVVHVLIREGRVLRRGSLGPSAARDRGVLEAAPQPGGARGCRDHDAGAQWQIQRQSRVPRTEPCVL